MFRDVFRSLLGFEGNGNKPQNFLEYFGPAGLSFVEGRRRNVIEFRKLRFDGLFRSVSHGDQGSRLCHFPT